MHAVIVDVSISDIAGHEQTSTKHSRAPSPKGTGISFLASGSAGQRTRATPSSPSSCRPAGAPVASPASG